MQNSIAPLKGIGIIFASRAGHIKRFPLVWEIKKQFANYPIHLIDLSTEERAGVLANFEWFGFSRNDFSRPKQFAPCQAPQEAKEKIAWLNLGLREVLEKIGSKVSHFVTLGDTEATFASTTLLKEMEYQIARFEAGYRDPSQDTEELISYERYRRQSDHLADLLFAPTEEARENLIKEKIPETNVAQTTGHPLVDALDYTVKKLQQNPLEHELLRSIKSHFVLVNLSKKENFQNSQYKNQIIDAIRKMAESGKQCICLVHESNLVCGAFAELKNVQNITLSPRVSFPLMITLKTHPQNLGLISDSGGDQEESSILRVPLLLVRPSGKLDRHELLEEGRLEACIPDSRQIIDFINNLTMPNQRNVLDTIQESSVLGQPGISRDLVKELRTCWLGSSIGLTTREIV